MDGVGLKLDSAFACSALKAGFKGCASGWERAGSASLALLCPSARAGTRSSPVSSGFRVGTRAKNPGSCKIFKDNKSSWAFKSSSSHCVEWGECRGWALGTSRESSMFTVPGSLRPRRLFVSNRA